jgi:ribosomal protein L2
MNKRPVTPPGVLSKAQTSLRFGQNKSAGRNASGSITVFHRGGGSKRLQRRIDFRRHTFGSGLVEKLEYDPHRSSRIALVRWSGFTQSQPPATSSNSTHLLDDTEADYKTKPSLPCEPGVTSPPWYEEALGCFATKNNIALQSTPVVVYKDLRKWSLYKRLYGVKQRSFFSYILAGDKLQLGDEVLNVHPGVKRALKPSVHSRKPPEFHIGPTQSKQAFSAQKRPGSLYASRTGFTKQGPYYSTKGWKPRLTEAFRFDTQAPLHNDEPSVLYHKDLNTSNRAVFGLKVKPYEPPHQKAANPTLRRYAPPWWTTDGGAPNGSTIIGGLRAVFLRPRLCPSSTKEQAPTAAVPSSVPSKVHDTVFYQQVGNCGPLSHMPIGTCIHNIEWHPGQGAKGVRAGGSFAQLVQKWDSTLKCVVRLPSGHEKQLDSRCRATIGIVSVSKKTRKLRKAGQTRWLGIRPTVRGVAMNPVDHPHGGGEGRTKGGRPSVSPWGKPTKGGFKTVMRKRQRS